MAAVAQAGKSAAASVTGATAAVKEQLNAVKEQLGAVGPNMKSGFADLANYVSRAGLYVGLGQSNDDASHAFIQCGVKL